MAIFNPQVDPTRDPNFFKYSDSISQPKADESKGIALKTLGEGIEGGFKLADTVVKDIIKSDVYEQVDKERKDFSAALTNTKNFGNPAGANAPAGNDPANSIVEGTPGGPVDLFAGQKPSVPSAINAGIKQAATVQAGLDGNKISQTTYYQRLDDIAVKMRTAYPGYRDFIDQQISHITGVTPANAYVDSIIQDINRQSANANKEKDFWVHQIVNSGFPDNDKVLAKFEKDGDHNAVARYLAENNGIRSQLALKEALARSKNTDRETARNNAEDYANSFAINAATEYFRNGKYTSDNMSPAEIADRLYDLTAHPEKANDEAYLKLSQRYTALHAEAYNKTMLAMTNRPKGANGELLPSIADQIGPDKVKSIVDKSIGALFDATKTYIADKQFGPAYSLQASVEAATSNKTWAIFNAPKIGDVIQTHTVFNKLIPNFVPLLSGGGIANGLDKDLGEIVSYQTKLAAAQPKTAGKYYGQDGIQYSFRQSIEELDQAGRITGKPVPSQALKSLTDIRKIITNPMSSPEAISNVVKYYFDPKVNGGVMDKFIDDYYDPAKNATVKGRSSAFADLTEDSVTKAIWGTGNKGDWKKYSDWSHGEFATQFGNTVRELNNVDKAPEGVKHYATTRISWDATNKQIIAKRVEVVPEGNAISGFKPGQEIDRGTSDEFKNLNMGLRNLANIAKTEGSNVDAYLFKVLLDNGFRPNKDIEGVPAQIMRAMIAASGGKVKEAPKKDNSEDRSRFAPEDAGVTLQQFLMNPAGSKGSVRDDLGPHQTRGVIKGNLSDNSELLGVQVDSIPEGMSARDFIRQLKAGK